MPPSSDRRPDRVPWSAMPAGAVLAVLAGRTLVVLSVPLVVVVHSDGQASAAVVMVVGCVLAWSAAGALRTRGDRPLLALGGPVVVVGLLLGLGGSGRAEDLVLTAVLGLLGVGLLLGRWAPDTTRWLETD